MNGFLFIDKPKGWTSQDVVAHLKKKLNLKKCGHSGTLDPNTTGLLVVACDEATKMLKLINEHDKTYITTIIFGYDSNTLDTSGEITCDFMMDVNQVDLDKGLEVLKNQTKQIPPMVSAIKINGKRLYQYERKNQVIEVPARDIKIYDLKQISDLRFVDNHYEVDILIKCSKGFYVRSFARDLGEILNGKAIMKELRRIESGDFNLINSVVLSEVTLENIIPITDIFCDFEYLEVNDYIAHLAKNGVMFDERQIKTDKPFYVVHNKKIIAIYEVVDEFKYKPLIIFKETR